MRHNTLIPKDLSAGTPLTNSGRVSILKVVMWSPAFLTIHFNPATLSLYGPSAHSPPSDRRRTHHPFG